MGFKESYRKNKSQTSTRFETSQKIVIVVIAVVLVAGIGVSVLGGRREQNQQTVVEGETSQVEAARTIMTGSAVSTDDKSEVRIKLFVEPGHNFKEIWANYSDHITKLEESAGTNNTPRNDTPENKDLYEVFVDVTSLEEDTTYYYQAVGKTQEDVLVYGQIASFSLDNLKPSS